jgi:hypothetical protein
MNGQRGGFTLLELTVGTAALGTIGYVLAFAFKASADSQREIARRANENRVVREASRALLDELAMAGESTITFTHGGSSEPTLRFQVRIEDGGSPAFGLRHMGVAHAGWTIVYAVEEPAGATDARRLVRRVEDDTGVVVNSRVVVRNLCADDGDPPGFRVEKAGDLWEVTLSTEGVGDRQGIDEVFHVRARN